MILKQFKKSQIIFRQGEVPTVSYRIKEGLVRAYMIHTNGEEATMAFFGPSDIFTIAAPFGLANISMFYYEAVVDTVCECYKKRELVETLEADARQELHRFARRYTGALLHIAALAQNLARHKVIHTLRYLAIRFGHKLPDSDLYEIGLRLTQHDIAKLCNISRETSSIEIGRLKKEGAVTEHLKHYIIDMVKLDKIIGDDSAATFRLN